jgi:hypothetical protein
VTPDRTVTPDCIATPKNRKTTSDDTERRHGNHQPGTRAKEPRRPRWREPLISGIHQSHG